MGGRLCLVLFALILVNTVGEGVICPNTARLCGRSAVGNSKWRPVPVDLSIVTVLKGTRRCAEQTSRPLRLDSTRCHAPELRLRLIVPLVLPTARPRRLTGYPPKPTLPCARRNNLSQLDG